MTIRGGFSGCSGKNDGHDIDDEISMSNPAAPFVFDATTRRFYHCTLHAATWGAELAKGEGPGRIYLVEPIGSFMDDPNLTDRKFPGNPTKSYRSREPLRVVAEYLDWQGHSPEEIQAMKDAIAGLEPIDD